MFLAVKELIYAKIRFGMVMLIMVLLSFLVLFVSGLAQGLSYDNASSIIHLDEEMAYIVLDESAELQVTRSLLQEDDEALLHDAVTPSEVFSVHQGPIFNEAEKRTDVTKMYLDPDSDVYPDIIEGTAPADEKQVIADVSLKEDGYDIGDSFDESSTGLTLTISGFTENQKFSHTPAVFLSEEAWFTLGEDEWMTSAILLPALDADTRNSLQGELSASEIVALDDALSGIPGYSEEQGSLWMMIAFLFVISAFVLAAFFYVLTIQKLTQFGILKALGVSVSRLVSSVIAQVLIISFSSVAAGIAGTYIAAALLPAGMPFMLPPSLVLILAGLFLAVAVLGSLLSVRKIKQVDALEAIGGMEG